MVKIESISEGASVTAVLGGERKSVFAKQLITYAESRTLEVVGGTVVYSIDEIEVVELSDSNTKSGTDTGTAAPAATPTPAAEPVPAPVPEPAPAPAQPVASAAKTEAAPKKVIIQPAAKPAAKA